MNIKHGLILAILAIACIAVKNITREQRMKRLLLSCSLMLFSFSTHATVISLLEDATNGGNFFAQITVQDVTTNTVNITADISDPINLGLTNGDILSMGFNLSSLSGLGDTPSLSNIVVNGTGMSSNEFFSGASLLLGQDATTTSSRGRKNTNLNGTGTDSWDLFIETGQGGAQYDFIQSLSFDFTLAGLDENYFSNQQIAMRVQSIEDTELFTGSSSKLLGVGSEEPLISFELTNVPIPEPAPIGLFGLALFILGLTTHKSTKK